VNLNQVADGLFKYHIITLKFTCPDKELRPEQNVLAGSFRQGVFYSTRPIDQFDFVHA
jgi:hypothetical protein